MFRHSCTSVTSCEKIWKRSSTGPDGQFYFLVPTFHQKRHVHGFSSHAYDRTAFRLEVFVRMIADAQAYALRIPATYLMKRKLAPAKRPVRRPCSTTCHVLQACQLDHVGASIVSCVVANILPIKRDCGGLTRHAHDGNVRQRVGVLIQTPPARVQITIADREVHKQSRVRMYALSVINIKLSRGSAISV